MALNLDNSCICKKIEDIPPGANIQFKRPGLLFFKSKCRFCKGTLIFIKIAEKCPECGKDLRYDQKYIKENKKLRTRCKVCGKELYLEYQLKSFEIQRKLTEML